MRELIERLDDRIDSLFDQLRGNPVADRVFYGASTLGEFSLLWMMLALLRGLRGRRSDERAALRAILAAPIESLLVNVVMKSVFQRKRPDGALEHPYPFRVPVTSSFPSGHATSAFCAATLLADDDRLAPLYYAAASVVAASRIHAKIHHASDVAGGVVIGLALGALGRRLAPLPHRKGGPRR